MVYKMGMNTMDKDFLALAWDIYRTYEGGRYPLYRTREGFKAAIEGKIAQASSSNYRLEFYRDWIRVTFVGIDFAHQEIPRVVQMAQGIGCTISPDKSFQWERVGEANRCRNTWQLFIVPAGTPYQGTIDGWLPPYSLDLFEYSLELAGTNYSYRFCWVEGEYHLFLTGYEAATIESAKQLFKGFPQVESGSTSGARQLDVLIS